MGRIRKQSNKRKTNYIGEIMKTAISELIWFISDDNGEIDESVKVSEIWEKCKELLEKEKQQIVDASVQANIRKNFSANEPIILGYIKDAEQYYSETFNNKN